MASCIDVMISRYQIVQFGENAEIYIQRMLEEAKVKLALATMDTVINLSHPVILDAHLERVDDSSRDFIGYRIHYRYIAVQSMNVGIPVFTFVNVSGNVEWKCPACSTINPIRATHCGEEHKRAVGCGRPRDKTVQEMEKVYG